MASSQLIIFCLYTMVQFMQVSAVPDTNTNTNTTLSAYYDTSNTAPLTTTSIYTTESRLKSFWDDMSRFEVGQWNLLFVSICSFLLICTFCSVTSYLVINYRKRDAQRKERLKKVIATKRSSVTTFNSVNNKQRLSMASYYSGNNHKLPTGNSNNNNIIIDMIHQQRSKMPENMDSNSSSCSSITQDDEFGRNGFAATLPTNLPKPQRGNQVFIV
eukprot:286333_1